MMKLFATITGSILAASLIAGVSVSLFDIAYDTYQKEKIRKCIVDLFEKEMTMYQEWHDNWLRENLAEADRYPNAEQNKERIRRVADEAQIETRLKNMNMAIRVCNRRI